MLSKLRIFKRLRKLEKEMETLRESKKHAIRDEMADALKMLLEGKEFPENHWMWGYCVVDPVSELGDKIRNTAESAVDKKLLEKAEELINGEDFIDEIIKRINRKQLSRK